MFCVRCGREGPTYESLCSACFLENNRFTSAPDHVDLVGCAHCKEFLIDGRWSEFSSLEDAVKCAATMSILLRKGARIEEIKADILPQDSKNFLVVINSKVKFQGLLVPECLETVVRLKGGVCPRCSKIMGSYYESILQVRARGRKFSDEEKEQILSEIEARVDGASKGSRDMFISKVEEMHGGLDVYLSASSLGKSLSREIAERYGAEVKESSSLVGQKDGKEVFRVTYLVRLPSYKVGDIIVKAGRPYLIGGIGSRGTRLVDLRTHESMNINNADLRSAQVIGNKDEALDAVVLTESDKELEVMDPRDFKQIGIKKTQGFKRKGDSVRAFPYEADLLLLPNWCQVEE
jgi:nonsense-mediated mRNA decay protein 3